MIAYVLTVVPGLADPISLTRIGDQERDVPVRGTTLADCADAILRDYCDGVAPIATVTAFAQFLFGGLEGVTLAVTVREPQLQRFCEAAGRRVA